MSQCAAVVNSDNDRANADTDNADTADADDNNDTNDADAFGNILFAALMNWLKNLFKVEVKQSNAKETFGGGINLGVLGLFDWLSVREG